MELEFDKEIDAILRKNARGPTAVSSLDTAHLEADEIAAFAENALPANARSFYTKHLANCDRCRTVLSQTISLYPEAKIEAASSAISAEPIVGFKPKWYQTFFAIPNLAATMGALVIVFAGLFAYLVYQKGFGSNPAEVAQVRRSETANENRPYNEPAQPSANAASNSTNTAVTSATPTITSDGSPMTKTMGQSDVEQPVIGDDDKSLADTGKNERLREEDAPAQPPPAAAPVTKEAPKNLPVDARKVAEKKAEDKLDAKSEVTTADSISQNNPELSKDATIQSNGQILNNQNQNNVGGAATKSKSGPYRDLQQRSVSPVAGARSDEEAPATRRAAGRSFAKKDGVWYDSAYRGQPTINIRRGTAEYKILDSGLRSIAESVGGTVVVVWKDKAYRIQ